MAQDKYEVELKMVLDSALIRTIQEFYLKMPSDNKTLKMRKYKGK